MQHLIKKYDRPGPRYTSFPAVPFWTGAPDEKTWLAHIDKGVVPNGNENGIDLYIHIPYCESLCYYCGCNKTVTRNKAKGKDYIDLLVKEWNLYLEKLERKILPINSIHFGGGTPTFLEPDYLDALLTQFSAHLNEDFLGSIEVDPRTCTNAHLDILDKHRFRRISMGIQDFDAVVQKAIHREQSFELVENLVNEIHKRQFNSVNFDLIHGLPYQSVDSIRKTIELVLKLSPDMIAFYSYAHLPDRIKNQKLIPEEGLPHGSEKRRLYEEGKLMLENAGLQEIGMDHFAKTESYLSQVQRKGKLLRNFMGYTDKKARILLGLGVTSISNSSLSFVQNHHKLDDYISDLNQHKFPIAKGHIHTENDILVEEIIQDIMCNYKMDMNLLEKVPGKEAIKAGLLEMEQDGLLRFQEDGRTINVTHIGKPFLRNISMLFDHNLNQNKNNIGFSKTI